MLFLRRTVVVLGINKQIIHIRIFLAIYIAVLAALIAVPYASERVALEPSYFRVASTTIAALFAWFAILAGTVRAALSQLLLDK